MSDAVARDGVFIPLRLDADERKLLKVLENALEVCEYTDTVDATFSHLKKSKHHACGLPDRYFEH